MKRYYPRKRYSPRTKKGSDLQQLAWGIVQIIAWLLLLIVMPYILSTYIFIFENPYFLIPVVVLILIIIWGIFIYKRNKKIKRYRAINKFNEVMKLDWREFEEFTADMLKKKWFHTILWVGVRDGGVDVTATLGDKKFYVQCKHYQSDSIGVDKIRELNWVMNGETVPVWGIFVTTTWFTIDAISEAHKYGIDLWDRNYLKKYLESEETIVEQNEYWKCELCGNSLLLRTTHTWDHIWQQFLWCEKFPNCRYTKNI